MNAALCTQLIGRYFAAAEAASREPAGGEKLRPGLSPELALAELEKRKLEREKETSRGMNYYALAHWREAAGSPSSHSRHHSSRQSFVA